MTDDVTHFDAPGHDPETCGWYECRHEREKRHLRAQLGQARSQCCMCGKKGLSIVEDGGPEAELTDGRWVCSQACWELAVGDTVDDLNARADYLGSVLTAIAFDLGQRVPFNLVDDGMDFDGLVNIHKMGEQLAKTSAGNTRMAMIMAAGACAAVSNGLTHYDNILNVVAASQGEVPERWGIPEEEDEP